MSECPWNDIDDALRTLMLNELGPASTHTTLKLTSVTVTGFIEAALWPVLAQDFQFPLMFVLPIENQFSPGPHGQSAALLNDAVRSYRLVPIVVGTQDQGRKDANTIAWRAIKALKASRSIVIPYPESPNTKAFRISIRADSPFLWPVQAHTEDSWYVTVPVDIQLTGTL